MSCCSTCAYVLESAVYCTRCAESIVDAGTPLPSSAPAASIWRHSRGTGSSDPPKSSDKARWIILVARDQPELFEHLTGAFANDEKVEIILDRRKNYRRNPPGLEERLRIHGAAIVRRRESQR